MGVAKLGWEACLIAKVGNDVDATMAFQALNSEGVNTTGVRRELGSDTGKAYIHVQEDGESMMTLFPGAVSYTHLDVYKRQPIQSASARARESAFFMLAFLLF